MKVRGDVVGMIFTVWVMYLQELALPSGTEGGGSQGGRPDLRYCAPARTVWFLPPRLARYRAWSARLTRACVSSVFSG